MDTAIKKELWDIVAAEPRPFNSIAFGENVRKGFTNVWKTRNWSDIILIVGKEKVFIFCLIYFIYFILIYLQIPAHRSVLIIWSETFRAMLSENWAEGSLSELPIHVAEEEYSNFKGNDLFIYYLIQKSN